MRNSVLPKATKRGSIVGFRCVCPRRTCVRSSGDVWIHCRGRVGMSEPLRTLLIYGKPDLVRRMTGSRTTTYVRVVPDHVVVDLRGRMPMVVAVVASAIQNGVPAYGGPATGVLRKRVEAAVVAGLNDLHGLLIGRARGDAATGELFRDLGEAEGLAGMSLESMHAALDIGTREIWKELRRAATRHALTPVAVACVVDSLFDQAARLRAHVELGHRRGLERRSTDPTIVRERLGHLLLDGDPVGEIRRLVNLLVHGLSPSLLVAHARIGGQTEIDLSRFGSDVLAVATASHLLIMGAAHQRDRIVAQMRDVCGANPIAVSIPCQSDHILDAISLTRRALWLVDAGVIESVDVVDCADYEVELWLHAEPLLRERLAGRLLAPIATKTAHRRAVFAQTLLLWLEQRASAPRLASQLGVHPQTIRIRMRKLEQMFAHELQDPELTFATMLTLKATMHEWLPSGD